MRSTAGPGWQPGGCQVQRHTRHPAKQRVAGVGARAGTAKSPAGPAIPTTRAAKPAVRYCNGSGGKNNGAGGRCNAAGRKNIHAGRRCNAADGRYNAAYPCCTSGGCPAQCRIPAVHNRRVGSALPQGGVCNAAGGCYNAACRHCTTGGWVVHCRRVGSAMPRVAGTMLHTPVAQPAGACHISAYRYCTTGGCLAQCCICVFQCSIRSLQRRIPSLHSWRDRFAFQGRCSLISRQVVSGFT
jgi:hypothetical protein